MRKKIMLLGSGELGRELVIALQRLGQYIIAVDSYQGAPAMQLAQEYEVINMLDGTALDQLVAKHKPDIIVPEIEAIRTERFYDYEKNGIKVVPSANAANYTMNRKEIRNLAAEVLKLRTARYKYAKNSKEFAGAVEAIGIPCVVKPLMSSSGKGQSIVRTSDDIEKAWKYAMEGSRGDYAEVIVEEFIKFHSEITLLTVTQKNGKTLFCPPIGHRQERENGRTPIFSGVEEALKEPKSDVRIFNKPTMRPYRRMAVALAYDAIGTDVDTVKEKAITLSKMIAVEPTEPI